MKSVLFRQFCEKEDLLIPLQTWQRSGLFSMGGNLWLCRLWKGTQEFAWVLLIAAALVVANGRNVAAYNTNCVAGNCPDVPTDGISYITNYTGVTEVNVGDGVEGETVVIPDSIGIWLSRYGSNGADEVEVEFETILWDTDDDLTTDDVSVVSAGESEPLMIDDEFIFNNGGDPQTFTIGSDTYAGDDLAQFLATTTDASGGTVTGSLTVNNSGADFTTTDATGIVAWSEGGRGGNGSCWSILGLYTHCNDGDNGGGAGSVVVNNNASITVNGGAVGQHGIFAYSHGGNGGKGGGAVGLFSNAGAGGDGGAGNDVFVMLGTESDITTHGQQSHGVLAGSRGGNGGAAGYSYGAFAFGDSGGNGGDAGNVTVDNDGSILTTGWNSHGIYAHSVGAGAGSGTSSVGIYAEGGNGGGESDGAKVIINNSGRIETRSSDSYGYLAQSIGGGGGDGGGAGGWFTVGGRGGSGGNADTVSIFDSGTVLTSGDRSTAIFAQSIGGGGGNGGDAVSVAPVISVAIGGDGGLGGDGHEVHVITQGSDIDTSGDDAHGIHAQSIGGGGGNGGVAVAGSIPAGPAFQVSIALGGNAGGGGDAGEIVSVVTSESTTIDTTGTNSYGIAAQSIGGGGGNGGSALAGSGGGGISVSVGVGGTGGVAGDGKLVEVDNTSIITTSGDFSTGIMAQSIGGGGGNGGTAGTLAVGLSLGVNVTLGGDGSAGGVGGEADVVNFGTITTGGDNAIGIFAQSIGGSGGNGGSALSGSAGLATVGVSIAGGGGDGNNGGLVDILNEGRIATLGNNSSGIFAQSIGGGGGNGGNATSIAIAGPLAVTVGVGGTGGSGGIGGNIAVTNEIDGVITTEGINSDGLFAQSIGGGGGSGGNATTASLVFPVEIEGVEIPAISASVALGGSGGDGGIGGRVDVFNYGEIETTDLLSNGIFAQSVGGSGGRGGNATNIQITVDALFAGSVVIGGSGGDGGIGNTVTVKNYESGLINTHADFSNGIFAQSIGGGGGLGGNATTVSLSLTPPPTSVDDLVPTPSMSFHVAVGGDGGAGGTGGNIDVANDGAIVTDGHFSTGIMAQSVGGSGGVGGDARVISVELTANPLDFNPLMDLMSFNTTLVFGGNGGDGSQGGDVSVSHTTDLETIGIATSGAFSHGIVAQSIGGNGGSGGSAMTFEFSNADIMPEIPVLDDITGLTTIEMTLQGSGSSGGDGGDVTLNSEGNIWTEGDFAMGVVAQSVAGGGGLAGFYNPHGITNSEIVNTIFNTLIDTDAGLSFAGSAGGAGTAGAVLVDHTGDIQTSGDGAHGLFAQSAAGQGSAGNVNVILDGNIYTTGENAFGVYAQSGGTGGNGDISVTIHDGIVMGGFGMGSGLYIAGGNNNRVWNSGLITSQAGIDGHAIRATGGGELIENSGTVTGNVSLGSGANAFNNKEGAIFNSGATVDLGSGNLLNNAGTLSPGGSGNVLTTAISGNLLQTDSGSISVDIDCSTGMTDRLNASGTADLAGVAVLSVLNPGRAVPGTHQSTIVAGAGGATDSGLSLVYRPSAVVNYTLLYPNSTDVVLRTNIDFSPRQGLNRNQREIGEAVKRIQLAGGTDAFSPIAVELLDLPDVKSIGNAYDKLSPESYDAFTSTAFEGSRQHTKTLIKRIHSIRSYLDTSGIIPGIQQVLPHGAWLDGFVTSGDQDAVNSFTGFDYRIRGFGLGFDKLFNDGLLGGISYGQSYTSIDLDSDGGDGDIDSYLFSLYGSMFSDKYYLDVALSYGKESYNSHRYIEFGALNRRADSDHDGDLYSAYTEAGYNLEMDKWIVQPFAALQYIYLDEESYRESGAGALNLVVDGRETDSLVSDLGLRFNRHFGRDDFVCIPEVSVAWRHDFDIDDRHISAAFEGAPDVSFTTASHDMDDGILIGIGVTVINRSGMSMYVRYDDERRGDFTAQRISGGMRFEF